MGTEFSFENGTLTATRVYDAPRELVFEAWISTDQIKKWWGCASCVGVRSEVEPQVGGKYNHHMTLEGVEGEIPGPATLIEYDPPSKLAYESDSPAGPGEKMIVSVVFEEVEEGTRVTLTHSGIPDMRVEGDIELNVIIQSGWTAALEKLDGLFVG